MKRSYGVLSAKERARHDPDTAPNEGLYKVYKPSSFIVESYDGSIYFA
jgi:hypothetical protein